MNLFQEFIQPATLDEAFHFLNASSGPVSLLAGGTDLLLDLRQGYHPPVHTLVDVTSIPDLSVLEMRGNELFIGAAVPLARIASSPLVREHARDLQEACRLIGGPQVRNVATLGGNVAHALPAADGTIAMMCLETKVTVASQSETRELPLHEMFLAPIRSILQEGREIIVGFSIPKKKPGRASAYMRIMIPQGTPIPILNIAIWVERNGDILEDIRIAVGPAQDFPTRRGDLENQIKGQKIEPGLMMEFAHTVSDQIPFRSSRHRSSAEYRHHLVRNLFLDTFQFAWSRAGETREQVDV